MSWWNGRLCAFDVETTGVNVETDRIVSATVALVGGGLMAETFSVIVDPGVEIPEGAAAVHGITTERARAEGAPARQAIEAITAALVSRGDAPIVAFNARFDLTVLDREQRRHGVVGIHPATLRVADPLVLDKHLDPYRKGSRNLATTAAHYGVALEDAHDAASDALAAARLAWVIGKRGEIKRHVRSASEGYQVEKLKREWARVVGDLPALHAHQVEWARGQAESLASYFRGKGQLADAESVRPEWPMIPFAEERAA